MLVLWLNSFTFSFSCLTLENLYTRSNVTTLYLFYCFICYPYLNLKLLNYIVTKIAHVSIVSCYMVKEFVRDAIYAVNNKYKNRDFSLSLSFSSILRHFCFSVSGSLFAVSSCFLSWYQTMSKKFFNYIKESTIDTCTILVTICLQYETN